MTDLPKWLRLMIAGAALCVALIGYAETRYARTADLERLASRVTTVITKQELRTTEMGDLSRQVAVLAARVDALTQSVDRLLRILEHQAVRGGGE